jgi:photosystem II stability/assembly factor-like uncharacterized protein
MIRKSTRIFVRSRRFAAWAHDQRTPLVSSSASFRYVDYQYSEAWNYHVFSLTSRLHVFLLWAFLTAVALAPIHTYAANNLLVSPVSIRTAHDGLFDIHLLGRRGWAVGDHGLLLTTHDGGISWQKRSVPTTLALFGIDVHADGHGVAVGQYGIILHTVNRGEHWNLVRSDVNARLFSVSLERGGFGLAVGEFGTVLRTVDHGNQLSIRWERFSGLSESPHLYGVFVENSQRATIVGEFGLVLHTDDLGNNWSVRYRDERSLFNIRKFSSGEYWSMGQDGLLLRSHDLGRSWEKLPVNEHVDLLDIYLAPDGRGILVGRDAMLYSTDGGKRWYSEPKLRTPAPWYQAVTMTYDGMFLVAGAHGSLLRLEFAANRLKHKISDLAY